MAAAEDLPDLEHLIRNVLRAAMEATIGESWLDEVSSTPQKAIEKAGNRARTKRPDDPLRDDWDAAGLDEIAGLLRSVQPLGLGLVWPTREHAAVDLDRLKQFRDKNLHAVGPPPGQLAESEAAALVLRLRVSFEAWRRSLADERGDWWPWIAAIHSNIAEFTFERSESGAKLLTAVLRQGDLVTLDAVGVHPSGEPDRLAFKLQASVQCQGVDLTSSTGSFSFEVERWPIHELSLRVFDCDEPTSGEAVILQIRVRPT